ncbi:MAG TPA: TonB-dependent receptor [Bryobacteraceae bacterium]|nr:TonB-dependent receptor [Bryobacteraceae bacterium]
MRASALCLFAAAMLTAQSTATVRGVVLDPSGAAIPNAALDLSGPNGAHQTTAANEAGGYSFTGLASGDYSLRVAAAGFAPSESKLSLDSGRVVTLDIHLVVAADRQQVTVSESQPAQVQVDPSLNAGQIVVQGKDLDFLSDNEDDLEADLIALAGPSAGPNGGQIFLDGFTQGDIAGKANIREVRVNANPFSAENDRPGFGRIDVITASATDRLHGSAGVNLSDSALNARNPYSFTKPPTQMRLFDFNLTGPLSKSVGFTFDAVRQAQDNSALINAVTLDSSFNPLAVNQIVQTPFVRRNIAPRIDYRITPNITFTARYSWFHPTIENNGIGGFTLLSRATSSVQTHQSGTFTLNVVHGSRYGNETRFQYHHLSNDQTGPSNSPSIVVAGAFSGGGAPFSNNWVRESSYEFQNMSSYTSGPHFFKFGVRVRAYTVADSSTINFNGAFAFTSLHAYQVTLQGLAAGLSMAQIQELGGGPYQYSITAGAPLARLNQVDAAPYLQDDWKLKPNLTLSLGLRYEAQTDLGGLRDWAPRAALAWGFGKGSRTSKTVLRLGYGIFYDRVSYNMPLQALHQNGIAQQFFVVANPLFFSTAPPPSALEANRQPQAIQLLSNSLEGPRNMQSAVTVERQLPSNVTLSVSFIDTRGVHQLRSRDINAPLPSGIFPYGTADPLFLYESSAMYKQWQLSFNVNARVSRRLSLFGYYTYGRAMSSSDGYRTFPADNYDLASEWGRLGSDMRHRAQIGGTIAGPLGIQFAPNVIASSAPPVNITTGTDLNGDTLLTDRPAFAVVPPDPAHGVVATRWGVFNLDPIHNPAFGSAIIPRNFGTAYGRFDVSGRISRAWKLHDRYSLTLAVQGRNWFNHVNPGPPVAILTSPFFGQPLNLDSAYGSTANRRVETSLRFGF